jgi:hypothetical protein
MSESGSMVERVALRLFWRAEHLDPSADAAEVPEGEYGEGWPQTLSERKRSFWRWLAKDAITAMREPTEAMRRAGVANGIKVVAEVKYEDGAAVAIFDSRDSWQAMIEAALGEK